VNAILPPRSGYTQVTPDLRPSRTLEYDTFARTTQMLTSAWRNRKEDFPALAHALNVNLRLWRILAADVAEEANALPAPLRAQIFYLYEFVEHHSKSVLSMTSAPDVLIDVNTAIMRGLRGQGGV
jgi:flagellar protein FlaF